MDTLKERYRVLTRMHHPDRGGDHSYFCQITEAGSTLLDEQRRSVYDTKLRLTLDACQECQGTGQQWIQMSFTHRVSRRCSKCKGLGFFRR